MPGDLSFAAAAGSHSGYTAQKGKTTDSDAHTMPGPPMQHSDLQLEVLRLLRCKKEILPAAIP